jgi:hypothetical protein
MYAHNSGLELKTYGKKILKVPPQHFVLVANYHVAAHWKKQPFYKSC